MREKSAFYLFYTNNLKSQAKQTKTRAPRGLRGISVSCRLLLIVNKLKTDHKSSVKQPLELHVDLKANQPSVNFSRIITMNNIKAIVDHSAAT